MSNIGTVSIYGRNDNPTSAILAAKSTIETGTEGVDWWVFSKEVHFVSPNIKDESETTDYLNNFQHTYNGFRMQYDLQFAPIEFPDTDTDINTLFGFLDVLKCEYIWLYLNDYKITVYSSQTTNVIRVNSAGSSTIETQSGAKIFKATFTDVKQNQDYS